MRVLPAFGLAAAAVLALAAQQARPAPEGYPGPRVRARVLGVAQDGGLPHLGCTRECCEAARRDPSRARRVASIALIWEAPGFASRIFLLDATPDLRAQVDSALGARGRRDRPAGLPVDGILLTHAHVGHYTGLIYLGRESLAASRVPVYATARMAGFLSANGPWKRLVEGGHIEPRVIEPGRAIDLATGLRAEAIRVPHREEDTDAVGFLVQGPSRRLLYIPDVDDWGRWDRDLAQVVGTVDVALLDGTFHSASEVQGRSIAEIPHPLVGATVHRLEALVRQGRRVIFIHMNHTNPLLAPGSPERRAIEMKGFEVADEGLELPL